MRRIQDAFDLIAARWQQWLIEPKFEIHDEFERRRVRLIATLMLILLVTYTIPSWIRIFVTDIGEWKYYIVATSLTIAISYGVSRTRWYRLGVWATLFMLGLGPLLRLLSLHSPGDYEVFLALVWYLYLIYIAAFILSRRAFATYTLLLFILVLGGTFWHGGVSWRQLVVPMGLYSVSALILFTTSWVLERNTRAMLENEHRFRTLLSVVQESVVLHDGERIIDVNDVFEQTFGIPRDRARGLAIETIVPTTILDELCNADRDDIVDIVPLDSFDGERIYVQLRQRRILFRRQSIFALSIQNISELVQARLDLEREHRFLVDVINALSHPFYVLDAETYDIVVSNRAAARDALVQGAKCYKITHLRDTPCDGLEHPCPLQQVKISREPYTVEHIHYHPDGTPYVAEVHGYPLFDEEGNVRYMVEYSIDVTERKEMERKLQEALRVAREASEFKSRLLANISHDLRTPLSGILGYAEMLQEDTLDASEVKHAAARILLNAHQMLNFINGFIHQAEIETGQIRINWRTFAVHELLDVVEAARSIAQAKGLSIRTVVDDNLPAQLYGDPYWLRQILANLLSNAIKFTDEGWVSVRLRHVDEAHWAIEVEDTGIGIPKEKIETIFEAFSQVEESGTKRYAGSGLGLSIVYQLVQMMGGTIEVESEVGEGTLFRVILPYQSPANS